MNMIPSMRNTVLLLSIAGFFSVLPVEASEETRLLRFPTIHEDVIVFSYAGNLYSVNSEGGIARRLTSHEGYEMFPRFSPDGKTLAFTGQYDGNTEVYLMDAQGGIPKRLTVTATLGRDDVSDRMGPNNIVMGWSNSGDQIVFRSRKTSFNSFNGQLYLVSKDGGLEERLPLPRGGFCSFSPDDSKLAYNRVFREFRTWKRYRGGMADDIWVYDFAAKSVINMTDHPSQDIIPMWRGDNIYFVSDRTGKMNLFVVNAQSKETRQLTDFKDFDIKFPSLGKNAIVFENGGYIYRFDLADEKAVKTPIQIADDFNSGRGGVISVAENLNGADISPDGKRAVVEARGDLFSLPAENGPTRSLTATPGVHERDPSWSPDGRWIAYISDQSGEDEIMIRAQDGSGEPRALTNGDNVYKYETSWSPDSKKIMWSDRLQRLFYVDVASGDIVKVAESHSFEIRAAVWSPDSKWIAYPLPEIDRLDRVYLYSLENAESFPATSAWFDNSQPAFSDDGQYLFVISARDFNPIYSQTEWNHAYQDMSRIYLIALNKDVASPFAPKSDEVAISEENKEPTDKKKAKKAGKPADKKAKDDAAEAVTVKIDRDGLLDRVIDLPIPPSNYGNIVSAGDSIFYMRNGSDDRRAKLFLYDLKKAEETELGQFDGYTLSADNKKIILFRRGGKIAIMDTPKSGQKLNPDKFIDLSGVTARLDRQAEWRQIYYECWRQMRDFFYDPGMHGMDWEGLRDLYAPLVEHVNHRNDLSYIIGELIGELNVGHAYVGGGDRPEAERLNTGLLGAVLSRHAESGFYRIDKILKGESWDSDLRSPLRAIGVGAAEGDYIVAVNGKATNVMDNIYQALIGVVGKQVRLKINGKPGLDGAREATVVPIADEANLYYHEMVQTNIRKVNEATDGKVGYVHIPDMGPGGLNQFVKHFYPQLGKKALIVDVRGNGGGNVSPMIIERLRREIVFVIKARNTALSSSPEQTLMGPMVCLIDEFSASDGDIFPHRFKFHKLGKLIGKRTWGGVVGIRGSLPLLDGGFLNRPEFARFDPEGKDWQIEGYGVEPDIYVDNDPAQEYAGVDQQLNKAIEVILEDLKTKGYEYPEPPAYPRPDNQ